VYRLGVGDLTGTYLADFELVVLRLLLTETERAAYDDARRAFNRVYRDYSRSFPRGGWEDFVRHASQSRDGRGALAAWHKSRKMLGLTSGKARALDALLARHRDGKVLIFTADNDAAYAIAKKHLIMPITCDISRTERKRALDAFRRGELRALVSARVLNEGIDVPDADVAIVVAGTQGEREHVQRVGRLLRPAPGKRAIVYELVTLGTSETHQAARRRRGLAPASATQS
jgi:superfamily II DNA or RNA helicase